MKYETGLVARVLIALAIFLVPYNVFYALFLKITVFLSYLPLLLKYNPVIEGDLILINSQPLRFIPACIATSAYYLLALLVLSTKDIKPKSRIFMFVIGSGLILITNTIRIDILIYTFLEYGRNLFGLIHLFFWTIVSSIYVVIVWIFLTKLFRIKAIPIYSDLVYLYKTSSFGKKRKPILASWISFF